MSDSLIFSNPYISDNHYFFSTVVAVQNPKQRWRTLNDTFVSVEGAIPDHIYHQNMHHHRLLY